MMRIIIYVLCIILLSSCGFSVSKQKPLNFEIIEIITNGDSKINFKLKNDLTFIKNSNKDKLIKINLETKKTKKIKERNNKNEITKYEINITSEVEYTLIGSAATESFLISKIGDYLVEKQHSKTINNERNLTKILIENLSEQLLENLTNKVNDL
jgi:hypothetical protein|tara:strand:+ start:4769 stop:5233 length:465 start_codon:yes stop_codon:yes gene_type:complete